MKTRKINQPRNFTFLISSILVLFHALNAEAENNVTLSYQLTSTWATGFEATVTIDNKGTPLANWRLEFDLPHTIESISNATVKEHTGNHYVFTGVEMDPTIRSQEYLSFWFVADLETDRSQFPANCRLNSVPCQFAGASETETESGPKESLPLSPWEKKLLNIVPTFNEIFSH